MKRLLALSALTTGVLGMTNGCSPDQTNVFDESGNAYCEPAVTTIKYTGVGGTGQYSTVTSIDTAGSCAWAEKAYAGSLAPYDEEIGIIFRGPLKLRQFAAYSADSSASKLKKRGEERKAEKEKAKRSPRPSPHKRRYGHGHQHFHQHQKEKRGLGDMVTAVIDGQLVSWVNNYAGPTAAADAGAGADAAADTGSAGVNVGVSVDAAAEPTSTSTTAAPVSSATSTASDDDKDSVDSSDTSGEWARISHYNSEEKINDGMTFLTHPPWQNVLAYAGVSGIEQASEATCFGGELDNADELIIMTDSPCSEDVGTECAYFKDGDEAFHGFGGTKKAFFFEFQMPDSGTHCSVNEMESKYVADNMPAIWTLNAKILTDQYGCNCQATGCGELDLFEVLNPGNKRMKSTFHGNTGFDGGDSHYIERPFDKYMSAIVVLDDDTMVIKVLEDGTEAPKSITQAQIDEWTGKDNDTEVSNILGQLAIYAMASI
ncbi:protein tos1 [Diplodia corticola]|uniref:glucan endo-1,3-beta-D-glucosidase n=1 Tax=Diplodia corticola TaxID=236234 RepID=A0A1J9RPM0_9PEZI|nr:protein tos1 [Diplodia corticola]OJD29860.1 protein tos1 [Diplodia corticola]